MNRHHLLPAAVALLCHVLFLGFTPSPKPVETNDEPAVDPSRRVVVVAPEPPPPPLYEAPASGGSASAATPPRPRLDELVAAERADAITMHLPPGAPISVQPLAPVLEGTLDLGGGGDGPGIGIGGLRLDQLDNHPRPTFQARPAYPPVAKQQGIEGTVTLTFVVDEGGRVKGAEVVAADHDAFIEPALRAVTRWKFEPGLKDGRPVSFRMTLPIVFSISD